MLRKLGLFSLNLLILACVVVLGAGLAIHHLRYHLADISDNRPLPMLSVKGRQSISSGHATLVFFRSTCPHCQHVIPTVYLLNKLSGEQIQYRDLNVSYNDNLGEQVNGNQDFPDLRKVNVAHHQVSAHSAPLVQMSQTRIILVGLAGLILLTSIALLLVHFRL